MVANASAPISRSTLPKQVTDRLRQRILHGEIAEGDQLRQDAIASEYGVSRMPVREALRQLEAEGLIIFLPHRGAVVSTLAIEDISEIFELRALIECDLLRLAIKGMRAEHLSRASEVLRKFDAAARSIESLESGELNWQFHSALYEAAGRSITMECLKRLHRNADRYLRLHMVLTGGMKRASKEHRELIRLCTKRDTHGAVRFLRTHILTAGRELVAAIIASKKHEKRSQSSA